MRESNADAYRVQGEELEGGVMHYNAPTGYNQGGKIGFRGCDSGGFGRGRGPIICYNCNHPGNLARDCLNPYMTCTYFITLDHEMEDCP
jgi:hypothetical protein